MEQNNAAPTMPFHNNVTFVGVALKTNKAILGSLQLNVEMGVCLCL